MKRSLVMCAALLMFAGCRSTATEPPPVREKFEVPVAPPGALGAYAAGTDAAPGLPAEPVPWGSEEEPEEEEFLPDEDSGVLVPDAGGIPL